MADPPVALGAARRDLVGAAKWPANEVVILAEGVRSVMRCIYNRDAVFDWDENNLRKIRAHRIRRADVEHALSNDPILIYEQNVGGESRFVYYGETKAGRLLAVVLTERDERIRVVTAYQLDAGQKKDYFARRLRGE